jgi:DNA-binding response OmpR family regulator
MESEKKQARGKILVVDDEEAVGKLLQQWLDDDGYEVAYAQDACEVAGYLEQETFDLVTLDIMMPGMDGLELLDWMRQNFPDVGVIMATALGNLDTVLAAMRAGAINYMIKPFNMDLVSEEIARGMERQRLVAENRAHQQELEEKVEERTRELNAAHGQLEKKVRELEGRDRLVQLQMAPPRDWREANTEILRVVETVIEVEGAAIFRRDKGGDYLMVGKQLGIAVPEGEERRMVVDEKCELVGQVFQTGESRTGAGGEVVAPIAYSGEVLGALWVEGIEAEEEEVVFDQLWYLCREAALVLRMVQMTAALEHGEAEIDDLLQEEGLPAVQEC